MDGCFDLDLSLTMVDNHPTTTTAATATATSTKITKLPSPEEAQNHVFAMPTITVTSGVCIVCMEGFETSSCTNGKQAPCGHIYHFDCITRWLSLHNSCPLCRSKVSGHRINFPAENL